MPMAKRARQKEQADITKTGAKRKELFYGTGK